MKQPPDWPLLARYLSGECTQPECEQVERWLEAVPENRRSLALMRKVWSVADPEPAKSDVETLWRQIATRADIEATAGSKPASQSWHTAAHARKWPTWTYADSYRLLRNAAMVFGVISLGYLLSQMTGLAHWPFARQETLTVGVGGRETLRLEDGTRVVLDAGSTLRYPSKFGEQTREIGLEGEGYFEVAHDASRPFVVHANYAEVRVLGTKFNVRAWQPDGKVSVAVSEGRVALQAADDSAHAVVITRGQLSQLPVNGTPSPPESVDVDRYLGWMRNELYFDDAPLSQVLFQLQRWYEVEFVLADSSVAHERLNIHLQNQSLGEVLDLLTVLTDLQYERDGKTVRLHVARDKN